MALIGDMFKGNIATGLAIGVGAVIFGPTVIQTMRSVFAAGGQDTHKRRYGFLPRNPERA
jgi:hypothetical protein